MPTFATLKDDFEDGVRGPQWAPSYGTIRETGGRAGILSENGYPALRTESTYTLIGSQVFVRAYPAPAGNATGAVGSEALIDSPTGGTRLLIYVDAYAGQIQFRSDTGYGDGAGVSLPYDPVAHAWWRFREAAGIVYMETSPDAVTWTVRRQVPTPAWVTAGNYPLHFSTHRETGDLTSYYFEIDNVNTTPAAPTPPATPTGITITPSADSAVVSWTAVPDATGYDVEYRHVGEAPPTAGNDQSVSPWLTVTLTGTGTGTWTQISGPTVVLEGTGTTCTFTAPPSMSEQTLVFDYGGDIVTVTVTRARTGIVAADGTVRPVQMRTVLTAPTPPPPAPAP